MESKQTQLRLLQVSEGIKVEIGRLTEGEVLIGRSPEPDGILVDSQAVSRNHGLFGCFGGNWFFRDLGSTNCSWLNGVAAPEGQWRIIRADSCLQVADVKILFETINTTTDSQSWQGQSNALQRKLMVFDKGDFLREFAIPEYGRVLVVGGHQANLEIRGELVDLPSLVVERRGLDITAAPIAKELPLYYNGQEIVEQVTLKDGDCLQIWDYSILFNDPPQVSSFAHTESLTQQQEEYIPFASDQPNSHWLGADQQQSDSAITNDMSGSFADDFVSAEKAPISKVFGQPLDTQYDAFDQTTTIEPDKLHAALSSFERHPSMRYNVEGVEEPEATASFEDRLIIIALIGVLLVLIGFAVWFVLL